MRIRSKVWLEKDGKLLFGRGVASILKAVEREGSLNKAAHRLNMPYRRAWSLIRAVEEHVDQPLLKKTRGGKGGGGASLTPWAKNLLEGFDRIDIEVNQYARERFDALLGTHEPPRK